MPTFKYQAYTLTIEAPLSFRELPISHSKADVVVDYGSVPLTFPSPRQVGGIFEARPGQFLLKLENVARYLVTDGNRITIDPDPEADEDDVRLFLLSPCLVVILLQQGGLLPLHASAVNTQQGAVLFMGYSGAGKSNLLAALLARGYDMLSDDVVPVARYGTETPIALPAFPYLKLSGDAARKLDYETAGLPLIRRDTRVDKFGISVERFANIPVPVRQIYLLTPFNTPGIKIKILDNAQKLQTLLYRTAGMPFIDGLGLRASHFQMVTQLGANVTIKRVIRPREGGEIGHLADAIEEDLG